MDLAEEIEIERAHPIVIGDAGEEIHENELTVPLASVSWLLSCGGLGLGTAFHNNNCGRPATRYGYIALLVESS